MNEEGEEAVSSDNDDEDYALLDEDEIQEIKKAKILERQQEEQAKKDLPEVDKFDLLDVKEKKQDYVK